MTARRIAIATALAVALTFQCGVAVTPVCADPDHGHRGARHEHYDHGGHGGGHRRYREHESYYYAPPPVYYYHAPPPVYVPPPSMGFTLIFPFRFR